MPAPIDKSATRLGLAVAAAAVVAVVAALAFDASDHAGPPPSGVASDAVRSPRVLHRVLVRPPGAPGIDDRPVDAAVIEVPPPGGDALPQPEPPRGTAVVMAPPERPAAPPAEPEGRAPAAPPAAAPRAEVARTVADTPDAGLARRLNREGIALIDAGLPGQAIAPLERAASLQPGDAEILGNLGYAYMLVGDHDTASRHFTRALDFAPTRSATWLNLGQTYAELGQRERAVDAVVTGYRYSTRKASVRSALLAAATGSRHSARWREAAGLALVRIGEG